MSLPIVGFMDGLELFSEKQDLPRIVLGYVFQRISQDLPKKEVRV